MKAPRSDAAPDARQEPVSILIGALGGEGGGVLTDWLVAAATEEGFPVQSTSIPGVAQRTGATTYYIEIFPVRRAALNGREPVLGLYPSPGRVDLAVMSELIEAGRAMENGMVTPERTMLVASTHRVFAIGEKANMADGRFEADRVVEAAGQLAKRAVLFDMAELARREGSVINAILLGVIAGSGALPFSRDTFERGIRVAGVAVEANLRGFAAGLTRAESAGREQGIVTTASTLTVPTPPSRDSVDALGARVETAFPAAARETIHLGVTRLIDYQDARYAAEYLDRLAPIAAADMADTGRFRQAELTRETARYLALWMSYEDAIRVAQLKTRSDRMVRIRNEVGARGHEPVRVREFLDPGIDEIAALMPPFLARAVLSLARRWPALARWRRPMEVRTDTLSGFVKLWSMARLRRFRRWTFRYQDERALIAGWLEAVRIAAAKDYNLALEIALCARLIKGYGSTYHRGRENFLSIIGTLVSPALQGGAWPAADALRQTREAALADSEGQSLRKVLDAIGKVR